MPGRNAFTVEVLNFLALVTQKAILFIFTSKKGEWKSGESNRTELRERLIKKNVASYITSNSFLVFWVVKNSL